MTGTEVHLRSSRQDVDPRPVREHEVEDHGLRRTHGGSRQCAFRGLGGLDVVARATQACSQGAQDLLLVVDDEDAWAAHTATPVRGSWKREHEGRALPGARLDGQPAAVRLREAACDREAEARPRGVRSPRPPLKRLEDALALLRQHSRPVIDHANDALRRSRRHLDADLFVGGRILERVLDQVHENPLDLVRVDKHGRRPARERHLGPGAVVADLGERRRSRAPPARPGPGRAAPPRPGAARGRADCRPGGRAARKPRPSS